MPQVIKSSPQLLAIYKSWLKEAASEAPTSRVTTGGLCEYTTAHCGEHLSCRGELLRQFCAAGLSEIYPFGEANYWTKHEQATQHLDVTRIAWVKARITDGEI